MKESVVGKEYKRKHRSLRSYCFLFCQTVFVIKPFSG